MSGLLGLGTLGLARRDASEALQQFGLLGLELFIGENTSFAQLSEPLQLIQHIGGLRSRTESRLL